MLCALVVGSLGCKVTAEDIETWKGTVKGPGKIVAVMLSDKYPLELRTTAAIALVEMERQDVDGVAELQHVVQRLDPETRRQLIQQMTPGLEALMRGGDTAQDSATGPPPTQVRAKDAAYLLITHAEGATRTQLMRAVVGWYVVDFNGRNLAGNYSAEQIVRSLGAPAAEQLLEAMSAEMPQRALVKIAELVSQLASDEAKGRAATRLVEIEQRMESDEFLEWLKNKVREQIQEAAPDQPIDENRVNAVATLNRENFINDGALPAMKHLASLDVIAERLIAIASIQSDNQLIIERRKRALQALEGNAKRAHLQRLLALALSNDNPVPVRDYAFDRVGDIRSPEAIPPMWPLVEGSGSEDAQRLRWRAGEMVLAIGGPTVVADFFAKLPTGDAIKYEPEELEGYATRMSQMNPPPTQLVRGQLRSPNWWNRVIALRYFERKGTQQDIPAMQRLVRDSAAVAGEHWEGMEIDTVGKVAEQAIAGLRERLSGGGGGEEAASEEGGSD
jgi:hypothetical protein